MTPTLTVAIPAENGLAGCSVRVETMGCRVNRYDAALLRAQLSAAGCTVVHDDDAPVAVHVLNTCTVTHQADAEARRLVRRAKRRGARVVVTGCYAEVAPGEVAGMPEVACVVPNRDKHQLVDRVAELFAGQTHTAWHGASDANPDAGLDAIAPTPTRHAPDRTWGRDGLFGDAGTLLPDPAGDTRLFLKVQEGCDVSCAYCIIPTARGRARSMPPERVVQVLNRATDAGYREAILAGIHLGGYGADLGDGSARTGKAKSLDFAGMVAHVLRDAAMPRIRFGSIEPWGLCDAFIDLFATEPRLLPHLHVPLQSGAAPTLKAMRRPCTPVFYARRIEALMTAKPNLAISTDVLTGFPGETDADFETGFQFIEAMGFSRLHVFPYSRRAGTPAADLPGQVADGVKQERVRRLIDLSDRLTAQAQAAQVGTRTTVLVEAVRADGSRRGHTENHHLIRMAAGETPRGTTVPVRVTDVVEGILVGVPEPGRNTSDISGDIAGHDQTTARACS